MTIYKIMSEWINFYRIGKALQFSYLEDLKKDKTGLEDENAALTTDNTKLKDENTEKDKTKA